MHLRKRDVAAAVTGNALEFYDFTTYSYFAIQIGHTFFPAHDPFVSLILSLMTFGVGFVMRPVGGAVIGRYADRIGRKPAMILCFALMGLGVVGLALTPSYASIGMAAPIIVVLIRLVQGFALGGDVGPTTSLLMEAAPPERRGLYGSMQYASQGLSTLTAGIVGIALANTLNTAQLESFGWRIAFLLGAAVVPVGLFIRRNLPETLTLETIPPANAEPVWRTMVVGLLIIMGSTTSFYVTSFLATYAQAYLNMKANVAFASTLIFGAGNIIFSLLGGWASDRIGRRPVMLWPRIALLAVAYPAFLLITSERSTIALLIATAVLTMFAQFGGGTSLVAITETLPKHVRSTAMATVYALGVAIFGGTTQPLVTWLIHRTNDIFAPAWWLMVTTALCIVALLMLRETAPAKVGNAKF